MNLTIKEAYQYCIDNATSNGTVLCVCPTEKQARHVFNQQAAFKPGTFVMFSIKPVSRVWFKTKENEESSIVFRGSEHADKFRGFCTPILWFHNLKDISEYAFACALPCGRLNGKNAEIIYTKDE